MSKVKLPDPHGMISRIRTKLAPDCSVRRSPYCDIIISMRMQSIPYQEIENFLSTQGSEYRIPSSTLWRNFKNAKITVEIPLAEEIAERWGGRIDLDVVRELAGQILMQRRRVDHLLKNEAEKQKNTPAFSDKRIRGEMETLNALIKSYQGMMKSPEEAAREREAADQASLGGEFTYSKDAEDIIKDMLLNGEIQLGGDITKH